MNVTLMKVVISYTSKNYQPNLALVEETISRIKNERLGSSPTHYYENCYFFDVTQLQFLNMRTGQKLHIFFFQFYGPFQFVKSGLFLRSKTNIAFILKIEFVFFF